MLASAMPSEQILFWSIIGATFALVTDFMLVPVRLMIYVTVSDDAGSIIFPPLYILASELPPEGLIVNVFVDVSVPKLMLMPVKLKSFSPLSMLMEVLLLEEL
jgi:hypothetical protein